MAALPEGKPKPEPAGEPPPRTRDDRDAAALLTPPPSGDSAAAFDAPTVVDYTPAAAVSPGDAPTVVDAPTVLDIGTPPRRSPAPDLSSGQPMLPPGTVLGQRYEIVAMLGEGGMGAVYKAIDRELNRPVALKVIRPELARNKAIIDRFKQELLLAREVTHRNVIRIYDLGEADRVKFITMEYVEGEDLRTLLVRKKKLTPEEAVEIIQQVCRALDAAHSVGIIHRDLKPQNIMRDQTGRILVMDFGLARTVEGDGMTQSGALVGTMDYMSPEQALTKPLDQRSDLYTVGLIFYELLSGAMPFAAESALASLIKRTQEQVAPVSDHDNAIPRSVSNIVSKCLERDVGLRYQTANELLADLEAWQGKRAAATLSFHAKVGPWGQTLPWPMIAAVATVMLLAALGWMWRDKLLSPLSKPASVAPQVSLAILPFRNASGDNSLNWMGQTLAEMLRTDMGESASLRTAPSDRVNQIIRDLRVEPDATLDPDTLRRIAEFTSTDRLLWGQYVKSGNQIRIDATLQDLKRQRNFTLSAEAPTDKDLPKALQQLAQSVEERLALRPETIKDLQTKSLRPSSESVQALRYYTEGVQLTRQGKNLDAVKQFEAATKEDANFALAYSKLGGTYAALGYGDKAQESSRKAVDLSDKISPQEKYLIHAEDAWVARDYAKAIDAYENLAKILPDDFDVQYALARAYEESSSFDKGRAAYEKLRARDPKNADILLRIGWLEIKRNNSQGALDDLNQALTVAVQLGNDEEKAAILDAIGYAYQSLNKLEDALRNYQQALDIKQRLGAKGGVATTLNYIAQAQQFAGKPAEALKNYQEALRLRREIGDRIAAAGNLLDMGDYYETQGEYDKALEVSKEALPILREAGDPQDLAGCLNNIGQIYQDKADYENAMSYFQQALSLRVKVGAPVYIANSTYDIGETYSRMGNYSQAMDYYLKALDLWRKAGNKEGIAYASYGLGRVFQYQGRYGAALSAGEDALKSWVETDDRGIWLPQMQANYANALTLIGRGDAGQQKLDEALAMARELKNNPVIAQILNLEGDRLFYAGSFQAAKTLFQQASQVASHTTDREQGLLSKFNLAKVNVKAGRSKEMVGTLQTLAEQTDRLGLKYLSVECSVYLAEALINNKDYSGARQEIDRILRSSEKLGLQTSLAKSHYLLGEALRLSGKQADASLQYTEAQRILDQIRKEAGTDDVLKRSDLATIYQESAHWKAQGT